MAPKHDTDHEHHNPNNLQSTRPDDRKLVTHKDESIPSVTMQNEDHTDIMDGLVAMVGSNRNTVQGFINDMVGKRNTPTVVKGNNKDIKRHPNPSMPGSTLHRISKMVMK